MVKHKQTWKVNSKDWDMFYKMLPEHFRYKYTEKGEVIGFSLFSPDGHRELVVLRDTENDKPWDEQ
jgi:hypothetical protein